MQASAAAASQVKPMANNRNALNVDFESPTSSAMSLTDRPPNPIHSLALSSRLS
jgi:hypothetical protein